MVANRYRCVTQAYVPPLPPESSMRVLIAGAGIAGLAAALALVRKGHNVRVIEQALALEEVGA